MGLQRFYAHPTNTFTWPNGAVGHRPGTLFDCLGPYAKVRNCPVVGLPLPRRAKCGGGETRGNRYTCYATGYADTYFSIPAVTKVRGVRIRGYLTVDEAGIEFRMFDGEMGKLQAAMLRKGTIV